MPIKITILLNILSPGIAKNGNDPLNKSTAVDLIWLITLELKYPNVFNPAAIPTV